jgi:uncharacterized membrane protein
LLSIGAAWMLLVLALWASDSRPAVFVLGGIVAALGSVLFATVDLARAVDEVEWTRRSRRQSAVRRADPRVSSVRRTVRGSWWSGPSEIADALVELIDDRLVAHHHVDRAVDSAAANAVLSPALRTLVASPRRSLLSPRELQQLLTEIELL